MPDVFVSYTRVDRAVARSFAEGFEREGLSVWWDQALNPGEAFDQVTEQALQAARVVVVLWSKASVNSRWVRAEATQASASNRLLPVMIEACQRPIIFELTHTVDLSGWRGDPQDPAWQDLLSSVRRALQRSVEAGPAADTATAPVARDAESSARAERAFPAAAAPRSPRSPARREVLRLGAVAIGAAAAGFAGGLLLRGPGTAGSAASAPSAAYHRLTFRRGIVRSARFAPDAQTVFYGALWDGERCRVHTTRVDNPESRALELPDAIVLAVSRVGDLALSLGAHLDGVFTYGRLARVPIAGGAPRELVEQVKFADWSPDGAELAAIRRVDGVDQLEFPLGSVLFRPGAEDGTGLGFARVSADGSRVAFIHYRAPQSLVGSVCVVGRDGRVEVVAGPFVNIHGLAWRGAELCFSASDDRPLFRAVQAVVPGGTPRVLARMATNVTVWDAAADGRLLIAQTDDRAAMVLRQSGSPHDRDLSWLDASWVADVSVDGRTVLFTETGQGVGAIPASYLRGTDGSPAIRLGSGEALALSPDGRFAAVLDVDPLQAASRARIDIVPTGAGAARALPGDGYRYENARWAPDGTHLVARARLGDAPPRLYRIDIRDGRHEAVTPEGIGGWCLSPDGRMVAAIGEDRVLALHPLQGGPARAIPDAGAAGSLLDWIDAGLLVARPGDPDVPRGAVSVLDPASGRQRPWSNILPRDAAGLMGLTNFAATPDGSTAIFTWHRALSHLYLARDLA